LTEKTGSSIIQYILEATWLFLTADYSDYSVFVVGAVAEDGMLYVHNVIREKMDSQEIVETMLSLQRQYNPMCLSMERGQIEKSIGPFLRERMLSRKHIYKHPASCSVYGQEESC